LHKFISINEMDKQKFIFHGLSIISWLIFVGLCIEAGGLLVNFVFSWFKPEVVAYLYQKLDMSSIYAQNRTAYWMLSSFIMSLALLKVMLFYAVIILVTKLDIQKPFSNFASRQIRLISYYTLGIGIMSLMARQTAQNLSHRGLELSFLDQFWEDSQAFILMAAVVYIIATIFTKGMEIQNENDLTV